MKEYICECGWKYIVGKKHVYGPIIKQSTTTSHLMNLETWHTEYGDCVKSICEKWLATNKGSIFKGISY